MFFLIFEIGYLMKIKLDWYE